MNFDLLNYKKQSKRKVIEGNNLMNAKQDDKLLYNCSVCNVETSRTISSLVKRGIDYKNIDLSLPELFMCRKHSQEYLNVQNYGFKNNFQREEVKTKIKQQKIKQRKNAGDKFSELNQYDDIEFLCSSCGIKTKIQKRLYDERKLCKQCKIELTNLERYGVKTVLEIDEVRNKLSIEKGVGNVSQLDSVKEKKRIKYESKSDTEKKEIYDKARETNLAKYGSGFASTEKYKQLMIEKYGVENNFQREEVKTKIKKTNLDRYGVENVLQNPEIRERLKKTNLDRYGVENVLQNPEIRERLKKTNLDRYGVENVLQNPEIRERMLNSKFENIFPVIEKKLEKDGYLLLEEYKGMRVNDKNVFYQIKCLKCGNTFEDNFHSKTPRCLTCYPLNSSKGEKELVDFIKSIYTGDVVENDRTILDGKELDIYLPEINLAVEFDGLYWHSELRGKDKNYHLNKTIECENKGIKLLHIFEDEWDNKQEIVKSILRSYLGKFSNKYYGRKTEIKEVNLSVEKDFLNENHIQGYVPSSIKLGLHYEGELVSLLTIGKSRFADYDYEILRFANKLNSTVLGGFSKLMKFFKSNYNGTVITYSERRLFTGNIYKNNGFSFIRFSNPGYFYLDKNYNKRYNRMKFQKHKLKDLIEVFDENETEWENMMNNEYDRIWDCGNYAFELK